MISISDISRLHSKEIIDRHIQKQYEGDTALFISDINSTVNKLLQTNLKQVKPFIDLLTPCFKYLPPFHRPRLLAMKARFAHWSGQSKTALRMYEQAVEQLQQNRNFDAAARARQGLMDVHMYLGNYPKALEVGKNALRYFRQKNNKYNAARVMTNIGNVYHRLDRNNLSLKYYNRARDFFELKGGVPLAILDFNRANIFANLNQLNDAEKLYSSVSDQFRKNKMDLAAGKADYSLAYLYFLGDKYTDALKTFDRVIEIFRKSGDLKSMAVTQLDLVEINTHLNQFGSAVMIGEEAIETFGKLGLRYEQAKAGYYVSEAYQQLGDNFQAAYYLGRAEKLFLKENNILWLGMINISRARLKIAARRFADAQSKATTAYALFKKSGDKRRGIDARITIMETYLEGGQPNKVISLGKQLLKNKLINYQQHLILNQIGQAYLHLSNPEMALVYLKKAIDVIEKMLRNIYPDEIRFFFALDKYPTYLSAVNCLLQMNRVNESFLQHSKALAVLNQRPIPIDILKTEIPNRLLEIRSKLRASLRKLRQVSDGGQRQIAATSNLYRQEHRLWDTERKIRSYLYPSRQTDRTRLQTSREYSEFISGDEALVNYFTADKKVGAFCLSRGITKHITCPVRHQDLENTIRELHFLMEMAVHSPGGNYHNSKVVEHYLSKLHDWLIKPLNLPNNVRCLVLMLDGLYAQLPFAAFRDSMGIWMKDRYKMQTIVDPDNLRNRRQDTNHSARFRSAVFTPPNSGLPAAESEGRNIKKTFSTAHLYNGEKADIGNLRKELKCAGGFIHIATHASRSSENPLFSRIMMSDGPFFPFDLFGFGIKAKLVTLSGCQTAAPGIYYGNSFSLAKAFYQGGAECVLASLWPISDKISMIFMTEFYKALKVHRNISKAYGIALNKTCAINNNPAFWAPFVMLGI